VRVVALLVVACGCRAGPRADVGLADAADAAHADGLVDIADRVDAAPTGECALFDDNCPNQDGCYPDEELSGQTRCRPAGAFPVLVGCLLQNDCAPGEACIEVPGPGAVCLLLCRPSAPGFSCLDVNGSTCRSLVRYPGVGYCL
jgi:hypothetical protein